MRVRVGRAILNLGLILTGVTARGLGTGQVRYVFKGSGALTLNAQVSGGTQLASKQITFGLKPSQVRAILALTTGTVNFGDVSFVDQPDDRFSLLSNQNGYSGTIYPNVPPPDAPAGQAIPDPGLKDQWWFDQLDVASAWKSATGQGITIADCDAGYYWRERDLNANFLTDLRYDLSDTDNPTVVDDGPFVYHGTAVTAIMVGVLDGLGVNGIAFNAKLVPFQNFNYAPNDKLDKEEATAKCVLRAITTPNVNIIVLENQTQYGSSESFVGTRDAVRLAIQSGVFVVGAGGNAATELAEEKKDDTGSIIVGALKPTGVAEPYSNFGERVTVGAYGENMRTLFGPDGAMGDFDGTSAATPQVAATVALMKEAAPWLTPAQARQILQTTRTLGAENAQVGGRLNTGAAVRAAKDSRPDLAEASKQWLFRQQLSAILF